MTASALPTASTFKSSRQLTDVERELLRELFAAMPNAEAGVDSVRFQARHRDRLQELDQLLAEQFLRIDQEKYVLSLPALALMDTPESRQFLENAERLFAGLDDAYVADPRTPILVSSLAVSCGVDEVDARNALSYFSKVTSWLAFHPRDVLNNMEATVGAGDVVIKQKGFWAALDQLEFWRRKGPFQMSQEAWQSAMGSDAEHASPGAKPEARPEPTWLPQLPNEIGLVMAEVYVAIREELRALPAIGIRTALDLYFSEVLGSNHGTFEQKVQKLRDQGVLSVRDADHVLAVIDGGNASAHRGFMPDADALETIVAVGEQLLRAHYVLSGGTQRLKAKVPARAPKPAKKPGSP